MQRINLCHPSPCGPNSACKENNGVAICSCLPGFVGNAPACRPECVVSSECSFDKACINQHCVNPCVEKVCGDNAVCTVMNHSPLCTCQDGYSGNPFARCYHVAIAPRKNQSRFLSRFLNSPPFLNSIKILDVNSLSCAIVSIAPVQDESSNPCVPSPCGLFAQCTNQVGVAACRCIEHYYGSPPNCRPECTINSDCINSKACINERCVDVCVGACGLNAACNVINHTPQCECIRGYQGDAFVRCQPIVVARKKSPSITPSLTILNKLLWQIYVKNVGKIPENEPVKVRDPCNPSPCGPNAQCSNGICSCLADYIGDPMFGCHPQCILNTECPRDKSCIRNKCQNPCAGDLCGRAAICDVFNHVAMCSCPYGMSGNAYIACSPVVQSTDSIRKRLLYETIPNSEVIAFVQKKPQSNSYFVEDPVPNACIPSPCGPNSQCRDVNSQVICSCLPGYYGEAPYCKPECSSTSECALTKTCVNQKCVDPCAGACGLRSSCKVINHNAVCYCPDRYTGDPFNRCTPVAIGIEKIRQFSNIVCALTMQTSHYYYLVSPLLCFFPNPTHINSKTSPSSYELST